MAIELDGATGLARPQSSPTAVKPGAGAAFGDALQRVLQSVDSSAGEANKAVGAMLDGSGDVHDAMIALQKAQTTLELTIQMRNKLVQAYQDIMRMPV
jgi:flagellar hook-basal body complex protein FliE